jgi:hypothetical protein
MTITQEKRSLIISALADHAATLMRLCYESQRKHPERATEYAASAKDCLELAVNLEHVTSIEIAP